MIRQDQRGFSLIEMTITLAIVSLLMLLIYSMVDQTLKITMFNESHNDLTILSQRAVNSITTELLQTRMVFEQDAVGGGYRNALQLSSQYPVFADSLLPVIQAGTLMAPDTNTRFTGNSLLIARQLPPLSVFYNHDNNAGTPDIEYLADRYQFEYIYLSEVDRPSFGGSGRPLDLVLNTSVVYADFFQLSGLSPTRLRRLVPRLTTAGLQHAWDPGQPVGNAFYALSGAQPDGRFDAPIGNPTITRANVKTLMPGIRVGGRISGKIIYSVGVNPPAPQAPYPLRHPLRVFAPVVAGNPRFPGGFEVKIVGPAGNRQIMTRLVLMSNYKAGTYESQQAFAITAGGF